MGPPRKLLSLGKRGQKEVYLKVRRTGGGELHEGIAGRARDLNAEVGCLDMLVAE